MNKLPYPLNEYGYKRTSQNDEDGIINAILQFIKPVQHFFVEFGAELHEANCIQLFAQGWQGLFMDVRGGPNIKQERVTPANIMELLYKYHVPHDFGVLSIDIDGQDYWVWRAIKHGPPLVIIEYNGGWPIDKLIVQPRDDDYVWGGEAHCGASLLSLTTIGTAKGYRLVYANGTNAFFVRRDHFSNPADFNYTEIYRYKTNGQLEAPGRAWRGR